MTALPPPTHEVAHLVALIGPEATLALVERRGGTRFYVPTRITADHELWQVVGEDAARYLARRYGGEQIVVPLARQWRILVYSAQRQSVAAVARATGCNERTVHRVLRRHESAAQQLDLFGG